MTSVTLVVDYRAYEKEVLTIIMKVEIVSSVFLVKHIRTG
jgi:hypothetical protein